MTPINKVWSWSLGGQGIILTGVLMFRKQSFVTNKLCLFGFIVEIINLIIVITTFAKH